MTEVLDDAVLLRPRNYNPTRSLRARKRTSIFSFQIWMFTHDRNLNPSWIQMDLIDRGEHNESLCMVGPK